MNTPKPPLDIERLKRDGGVTRDKQLVTVVRVKNGFIFGTLNGRYYCCSMLGYVNEGESDLDLFNHPLPEKPKEEPKRWARAAYVTCNGKWDISNLLFESYESAKSLFQPGRRIIWPARFDKDGFLITEENTQ